MVCPNCHSDRIIAVQDQHFCINCGQQVPATAIAQGKSASVAVGENGLPEGVKILPIAPASKDLPLARDAPPAKPTETKPEPKPEPKPNAEPIIKTKTEAPAAPTPSPGALAGAVIIKKQRARIAAADPASAEPGADPETPDTANDSAKIKRRKPGRPKAGRLDVPRIVLSNAPTAPAPVPAVATAAAPASAKPTPATAAPVAVAVATGPRRLSDLAPRRTSHAKTAAVDSISSEWAAPDITKAATAAASAKKPSLLAQLFAVKPKVKTKDKPKDKLKKAKTTAKTEAKPANAKPPKTKAPAPRLHKVGVPPLHYGHVLAFSLRARVRPGWLLLGLLASASFAVVIGYGGWLFLNGGLPHLADTLLAANPAIYGELGLLALLYYIGRSIGQGAIMYGVARETDNRTVPLSRQLGVGINTFGRRLRLDSIFGGLELVLLLLIAGLMLTGGGSWSINPQLQVGTLFVAFLVMLYLLTALGLSRGLAGAVITLTGKAPLEAARLGWQLFSHRFELLSLRFVALALELVLAVPLAALVLALLLSTPPQFHLYAALGVAAVAWLAGALVGAGSAAWWAALYRRLVQTDRPADTATLLAGNTADSPHAGPLTAVVALSTFIVAAALALPWLKFF